MFGRLAKFGITRAIGIPPEDLLPCVTVTDSLMITAAVDVHPHHPPEPMNVTNSIAPELLEQLDRHHQRDVLRFWDQLSDASRQSLSQQLAGLDFELLTELYSGGQDGPDWGALARRAEKPTAIELGKPHPQISREQAFEAGEQLLRSGKVGMILVAGGQGSRLGFDKPKGMLPIGPLTGHTLFQVLLEKVLGRSRFYGQPIPLYIMSSPVTHRDTADYLAANSNFGIPVDHCKIFCQGTMPAVQQLDGALILDDKDRLFVSPDGHGGMLKAFAASGCLQHALEQGIETLYYGQVDNPLQQVCDPLTLGYHKLLASEMTTQVVRKQSAAQKVGNLVTVDGRAQIIEYSDLPAEAAAETDDQGQLKFWAGSIAVHCFETGFLQQVAMQADSMPFHKALKKVPYLDSAGMRIEPEEPNALKFEKFIFDLLPLAQNALAIEIAAEDGFAAVKNAEGAPQETKTTTQQAMIAQFTRWLEQSGVHVEPGVPVEIRPQFAIDQRELAQKIQVNSVLEPTIFE